MRVTPALVGTLLATSALVGACSTQNRQAPAPTGTVASSPTDTPPAESPLGVDFPDLSGYTESIDQFEQVNAPRVQGFSFSTPGGLICGSNAYPDVQFEHVGCRGPIPAQGPGDWEVTARYGEAATVVELTGDPDRAAPPPVLAPMHKVTASKGVAECGVDDAGTVACRIGQNGFVLTPSSVELF